MRPGRSQTSAARSNVHSAARARNCSAPIACSARNSVAARPFSNRCRCNASAIGEIGARLRRDVKVRLAREARRPWIDDDEFGSGLARCLEVWNEVNAGRAGVDAPEDDQPRVHVILIRDAGHLAVEHLVRRAGRSGAHGSRQPRRAKAAEEDGVVGVLREQPVRSAVAEGKDRFGGVLVADLQHPGRDVVERFAPGHPRESPLTLRTFPNRRIEQPILAVNALGESPHLPADVVFRDRVEVAAVDADDPSFFDGDVERAGVGTIERARRPDRRMSPGSPLSVSAHERELSHAPSVTTIKTRVDRSNRQAARTSASSGAEPSATSAAAPQAPDGPASIRSAPEPMDSIVHGGEYAFDHRR